MLEVEFIGGRWIAKDRSFSIIRRDRFILEYREGDHRLLIDVEPGFPSLAVYTDSIQSWEFPFEAQLVTPDDRWRIVHNIEVAFDTTEYAYILWPAVEMPNSWNNQPQPTDVVLGRQQGVPQDGAVLGGRFCVDFD